MPNLRAQWRKAKDDVFNKGLTGTDIPPEMVMELSQGNDLGPSLAEFEKAAGYEKRMACLPEVMKARAQYTKAIGKARRRASPAGVKALDELLAALETIWKEVQAEAQPPRPSNQMVSAYKLRSFNLAAGIKTEKLKVDPITIDVEVEVDKVFKFLIDNGQAGFRAEVLGNVAQEELDKVRGLFKETIEKVDKAIIANPSIMAAKSKEANEVLQYYGRLIQDRVTLAVQAEWKRYLGHKKDLKDFQVKTVTKVVLGSIGVAVAIASAALSFGTAWMNILAAVKGISDIAKTLKTASEGIDTTYAKLQTGLAGVDKLNVKREEARKREEKKKGTGGQKGSKALEMGKEIVAALLPITKDMLKATSAVEATCQQFSGHVAKLETQADVISGRLELITKNLTTLPTRMLETSQINLARRMQKAIEGLFAELAALNKQVKEYSAFVTKAKEAIQKLKREDSWSAGLTESLMGMGTKGVAIYGACNFIYACAEAGKQLIPV